MKKIIFLASFLFSSIAFSQQAWNFLGGINLGDQDITRYVETNSGNPNFVAELNVANISPGVLTCVRIGNFVRCQCSLSADFTAGVQRITFPTSDLPFTVSTTHQINGNSIRLQSATNLNDQGQVQAISSAIYIVHPSGLSGTAKSWMFNFSYITDDT